MSYSPALLVIVLTVSACLACGSSAVTPDEIAGEYALVRVDDSALPVIVEESETRTEEIIGGELILYSFAEYTLNVDFRITLETLSGPFVSDSTFIDVGPFTIDGDLIIMQSTRPGLARYGTLDGSSIIVGFPRDGPNLLLTYRR